VSVVLHVGGDDADQRYGESGGADDHGTGQRTNPSESLVAAVLEAVEGGHVFKFH